MVPAGPGCENEVRKKKVKRHMVFLLFYCISFRCRLLEDFGFGFVFCFSFSCRLLEGFGCGGECTKKNLEWMFWKVLAVKTNSQKTVKTPHGFPHFLWYLMHSGVMFSGFSGLLEVYGSGTAGPGCENAVKKMVKRHMVFFFFTVSHWGVGFWKILALGLFFASHSAVGFWKVLAVEMNAQKQLKIDVLESSGCENQLTKNS